MMTDKLTDKRRLPFGGKFDNVTDKKDGILSEDSAKADGANLGIGSTEYREMIRDHQGMDEFEQDKQIKESRGGFKAKDWRGDVDEFHQDREGRLAREASERVAEFERRGGGRLDTAGRKTVWQIRKDIAGKEARAAAEKDAAITPTVSDDKYVKRRLPKILEDAEYDDGVQEDEIDDIYPGMKTLGKYL